MPFGENLRKVRLAAGISRAELEVASGVSRDLIRRYETADQGLRLSDVRKLAHALGVAPELLLGVAGEMRVTRAASRKSRVRRAGGRKPRER